MKTVYKQTPFLFKVTAKSFPKALIKKYSSTVFALKTWYLCALEMKCMNISYKKY